jgi:hypothetical protein
MKYLKRELLPTDMARMRAVLPLQRRVSNTPVCDFCGGIPFYVYADERTATGEQVPCWRHCACKDCSVAIDHDNWGIIKAKLKNWLIRRSHGLSEPLIDKAVEHSLAQFRGVLIV